MSTAEQVVPILNGTFEEEGHIYRNIYGKEVPSVTGILDGCGFTDFDSIPEETLDNKRRLGDAVHFATKIMDESGELDWDTVHPKCVPYILAYENFTKEAGFKFYPEWIEKGGIHVLNGMPFGYTVDRVGQIAGIQGRLVIELKCAYKPEVAWRYQTAAYAEVVNTSAEVLGRVAVQLKPDGNYKLWPYENPRDIDVFKWALALTHTKINEGIRWKKKEQT